MPIASVGALVDAINAGQSRFCSFRKVPSQASTPRWADLSMASGNPAPNYYASEPLVGATLDGQRGIFHGFDLSPRELYLTDFGMVTPTAALARQYKLLDYLLYYPFVDMDDGDTQVMDNTVALPRYASGEGVQVMMVAVAPTTGGGRFTFTYVNQDGVEKVSPTQECGPSIANIASLMTSQGASVASVGPFLRLADGDTGVRRIVSHQNVVLNGGLGAYVLVQPLLDTAIYEINTMKEEALPMLKANPPRIYDGAYLGLIIESSATIAGGRLAGFAKFAWV